MRTSLRLPEELAESIRQRAQEENRSMHSMMLVLLQEGLGRIPPTVAQTAGKRGLEAWRKGMGGVLDEPAFPQIASRVPADRHFKPDFKTIK